ncbi:MAG TPA: hypothetical protein VIC85_07585 [Ktedonobacterales bacterium]|jgi:hypothetical protein
MQQPWSVYYSPAPPPAFAPAPRPSPWTVPLLGLLYGLFAVLQVVVSVSAAVENHSVIAGLYYGTQQSGFDPTVAVQWLAPMLVATYGSCLAAFVIDMGLCWYAGRLVAGASVRGSGGAGAGLLTSVIGSAIWIAASIVAVLFAHTDGTIAGLFATTPQYSAANVGGEIVGLVVQEGLAAALALGFGALAGAIGGASARPRPALAVMPPRAHSMPPIAPAAMPYPGAAPYPLNPYYPVNLPYPPPPEFYRALAGGTGDASPAAPEHHSPDGGQTPR